MSESKGPKVDLPDELMAELESSPEAKPETEIEIEVETEEVSGGDAAQAAGDGDDKSAAYASLRDKYIRLAADFDNFKRRSLKERQDLHNYATENLVKELLPTVDNLERAVGHGRKEEYGGEVAGVIEGVELTLRSLLAALEKFGVKAVDPVGQPFDPQCHEAVRQVPSAEHDPNTVVEVFQKGYLMKDKLLRPALVAVSSS